MPSIPFTEQDQQVIAGLGETLRPDGRQMFLGGFHFRTRYATTEFNLSSISLDTWLMGWNAVAEVANAAELTLIFRPQTSRNLNSIDYTTTQRVPYQIGLLKSGSPGPGWVRHTPLECGCTDVLIRDNTCPCGTLLRCLYCGGNVVFDADLNLEEDDQGTIACQDCRTNCSWEGCEHFIDPEDERCELHTGTEFGQRRCMQCGRRGYEGNERVTWEMDGAGSYWCGSCWEHRPRCDNCNVGAEDADLDPYGDDGYGDFVGFRCRECAAAEREKYAERITFDYNTPVTPNMMAVAALPDRPPRAVSVEQEMTISGRDGESLATELHRLGLSPYPHVEGYHSSGHAGFVHMETDSSIAGFELIYNRVDFSQESEQENAARVIEAVAASGSTFDATCGTHFHVDMHGLDVRDTKNLVIVYSYIEDPIYRVAGAGYDAHRSNLREGRVYAQSIQKQEWRDVRHFGREFLRAAAHDDSLNLQHYYQSMRHCECGAIEFGQQKECDCNLGKLTAEWRVFNGTNDPRKLRAWLALAQSVIAYAQDRDIRYADFRPLSYGQPHDRAAAEERLRWMLTVLPMTEEEKADLVWCLQNTALAHEFTDGELEGFVGEYRPERELPAAPEYGFRSSLRDVHGVAGDRPTFEDRERELVAALNHYQLAGNYPRYGETVTTNVTSNTPPINPSQVPAYITWMDEDYIDGEEI